MRKQKRKVLEANGWKVGTVPQFLGLTVAEAAFVERRLSLRSELRVRRGRA
jgi:hypothetical protein